MSLGSQLAEGWQSFAVANGDATDQGKRPGSGWRPLKSALLASAGSVIAYPAVAQQAPEPVPLPPLSVEATKKKAPAKKAASKKAPTQQVSPAPQAPSQPVAQKADPLPGEAGPPAAGSFNAGYSSSAKMTGPLLDTPQTVNVITNAVIEERNSNNLTEALRNVPGISFNAGENGFTTGISNFSIRGFDSSGNVFIDGVRDNGSYARDMFNVDRVEVVKGAAADNGRGGAGGYVNIVTKTPTDEDFVQATMLVSFDEHGTDPLVRSTIDANKISGTVAVRINGMFEDGGVMGRDFAESNAYGVAPSITFGMGTDSRVTVAYERLERQDIPDWGVPAAMIIGTKNYDTPAAANAPGISRDTFFGLATDFDDVEANSVVARIEHDLSNNFTFSNQTRYATVDRLARYNYPNNGFRNTPPEARVNQQFYDRENTSISNNTNLSGRFSFGGVGHTISTGVEYSHEISDSNREAEDADNANTTDYFSPNPYRKGATPFNPTETNVLTVDTVAAYLYDTVTLSKQWQVVGGLRVEHYDVDIEAKNYTTGASLANDGYTDGHTSLNGKLGLVYKPVEEGSFYVSYGASTLPPGSLLSNSDASRPGAENGFPSFIQGADPIRMHNYEAGVKWDFFGGRLSTTAALFRTEKENVPHTTALTGTHIFYEEQVVQGVEIGIAGEITDRWKMFGGILWLDSERKHAQAFDDNQCPGRTGDYGVPNAAACAGQTTNGNELAYTPRFSATMWTTYDVTKEFTVGAGFQYVGESWAGRPDDALRIVKNGVYGKLPDYFVVNAMASYELTDNVDLQFNVDNIFDEFYAMSMNWGATRALVGPPRTYRLGTAVKF